MPPERSALRVQPFLDSGAQARLRGWLDGYRPLAGVPDAAVFFLCMPGGAGGPTLLDGELLLRSDDALSAVTGDFDMVHSVITLQHIPYKGAAPAFVDLISGQVDSMFANIVGTMPHVRTGRVRAVAVSSAARSGN